MNQALIKQYYDSLGMANIKNKKIVLQDQELYLLHKHPKKDKGKEIPHIQDIEPHCIYQADTLYLPTDKGFKYCLVVVDVGTGITDAVPMKNRASQDTLASFKIMFSRSKIILPKPRYIIQCDSGSEFKNKTIVDYFAETGVRVRFGDVNRHRNQAYAENRNKTIGTHLFFRQNAQELITGKDNTDWVHYLPQVIEQINKYITEKGVKKVSGIQEPYIPNKTFNVICWNESSCTIKSPRVSQW